MKNCTWIGGMIGLIVAFGQLPAQDKVDESPYLPTKIGTTWHYRVGAEKMVVKVTKHEKLGKIMCARLETTVNGEVKAYEHLAVTKDGLVRVAYNGELASVPLLFLKLPPKSGDQWSVDLKIGNETVKGTFAVNQEKVKVPAGDFEAWKSRGTVEVNGAPGSYSCWIVEGKGIVHAEIAFGGNQLTMDLEKFVEGN